MYAINFLKELVFLLLGIGKTLFWTISLPNTYIFIIKYRLTKLYMRQHLPHFRYRSRLEYKSIIFVDKGRMLWFCNTLWHSEDNIILQPLWSLSNQKKKGPLDSLSLTVLSNVTNQNKWLHNTAQIFTGSGWRWDRV